jgi:hypothetical protein
MNGSTMSIMSMGATPSPQPVYGEEGKELQIIHMDAPEGGVPQTGPHPMASIMDRTPMKSITFHQERPERDPEHRSSRTRRPSVQSLASEDRVSDERSASMAPRAPSRSHSQTQVRSPVQRTASHSPALAREPPYSPHAAYHDRSPYHTPPMSMPTPQQQVPAPFASIMSPYSAPPPSGQRSPESPYEPTPLNGGVSRLRGSTTTGVDR